MQTKFKKILICRFCEKEIAQDVNPQVKNVIEIGTCFECEIEQQSDPRNQQSDK